MDKKRIFTYDFLLVNGGAESVALHVCESLEGFDLGVGFTDDSVFKTEASSYSVISLTSYTRWVGWQILKSAIWFSKRASWLAKYDTVVFSGICAPLGHHFCQSTAKKIMYCHTPPRFVFDLKNHYFSTGSFIKRLLIKILAAYLKPRYEKAIADMDLVIANSENVKNRLKRYLGREAIVIYPPCNVERFSWIGQGDYYLSTARLEEYKRTELVVRAFLKMPDKKLVVTSGGSQLTKLQKLAAGASNIRFTGWCSEEKLQHLIGNCIATIYIPVDEDFGMSPVESMAAGKPVIGVAEGGVLETIVDKKTGLLCKASPDESDVIRAVYEMNAVAALTMKDPCIVRARQFSQAQFTAKMNNVLLKTKQELRETSAGCGKRVCCNEFK